MPKSYTLERNTHGAHHSWKRRHAFDGGAIHQHEEVRRMPAAQKVVDAVAQAPQDEVLG